MSRAGAGRSRRRRLLDWRGVFGVVLSVALLYYAFRGVDLREVLARIREADLPLLLLASALATVLFPLRAIRWAPLLEPIHAGTAYYSRVSATCIGFMANNLLPARIGEFARAYALSRMEPIRISASFGSLVIERMFDGLMVVGLLLVALAWPTFPEAAGRDVGRVVWSVGLFFLALLATIAVIVAWPARSVRLFEMTAGRLLPRRFRRRVVDTVGAFVTGLGAIKDWRLVLRAILWSVIIWVTGALGFWVGFRAFHIDAPFIAAVFLQSVIALAVSLPSAPGFFGLFEAGARIGLVEVWGVATGPAMAFALGFHLAGFIPVTLIGLFFLWRLGMSLREVEASEEVVETAVEATLPQDIEPVEP